jgi:hypothetical protein
MAQIGSLTADLRLESAAFIRDLKRAADATARNTSAMQRNTHAGNAAWLLYSKHKGNRCASCGKCPRQGTVDQRKEVAARER